MTGLLLAGALAVVLGHRRQIIAVAFILVLAVQAPAVIPVLVLSGFAAISIARVRRTRQTKGSETAALAEICDLATICLTGGLGVEQSLAIASEHATGRLAMSVEDVLALSRVDGLAAGMASASGPGERLFRVVARAVAGGGPVVEPVRTLADQLWEEQAAAQLERARRLPVTMLFPLTLLILPGFMLLTIAPALFDAFARLNL